MKLPGLELRLLVVDRLLVEHRADALRDPARDLPVDDRGVDELAAVLDRDVSVDVHASGRQVDLDPAHVRRLRPAAFSAVVLRLVAQRAPCVRGDVDERHRDRRYPLHVDGAFFDDEILLRCLEQVGGALGDAFAQRARRVRDRAAGHRRRPAPTGAGQAERRDARVAVADADLLERHAELVGRDLGQRRLVTLTVGHLLGVHRHGAVGLEHRARRLAPHHPAGPRHHRLLEVGRSRRRLDERGEPEAEDAPLGARRGLPRGPVLEVGDLERALERRARRHADVERRDR